MFLRRGSTIGLPHRANDKNLVAFLESDRHIDSLNLSDALIPRQQEKLVILHHVRHFSLSLSIDDRCGYNILTGQPREEIVDPPVPKPSDAVAHWSHHEGGR